MAKRIRVNATTRLDIQKTFRCTRMTVWRALNYKYDSPTAQRIRTYAIKKGGEIQDITTRAAEIQDINNK